MKFVADESCAAPVIRALRQAGHDVVAIAEVARGATDNQVLDRAFTENRILITEDRDFGEMVFGRGRSSAGVILVRFPTQARCAQPATVVSALTKLGSKLKGVFAVVQPGRVRISARPSH